MADMILKFLPIGISVVSLLITSFISIKLTNIKGKQDIKLQSLRDDLDTKKYLFQKSYDKKFEIVISLWEDFSELEGVAIELWEKNITNSRNQAKTLIKKARIQSRKSQLFLDEELYNSLIKNLDSLEKYVQGKNTLNNVDVIHRDQVIEENRQKLEEFKDTLVCLKDDLKKML